MAEFEIKRRNGDVYVVLVDDDDLSSTLRRKWHVLVRKTGTLYAVNMSKNPEEPKHVYLHRWLVQAPAHLQVDHVNGNGLDNRRANLRICTGSQNQGNKGRQVNNASGFKGVHWERRRSCWVAFISMNGKNVFLGYFSTAEAGHEAYCKAAESFFGDFAKFG